MQAESNVATLARRQAASTGRLDALILKTDEYLALLRVHRTNAVEWRRARAAFRAVCDARLALTKQVAEAKAACDAEIKALV